MEILGEMKRELLDAVDFTSKKAGEITQSASLKYQIHNEKTRMSELYEKIGRLYYDAVMKGADATSEISSLMADVSEMQNKINDLERQLSEVGDEK
ncbi:MAG: hypothetical protein LUI15_01475 [Firmicutes bacterium]|nr:hypothetical protein [Bacillota bacterium]